MMRTIEEGSQGLTQAKNDSGYHFWAPNVWHPNSCFVSLSVFSKTVENENYNQKWHNFYLKVLTQRMLYLKTKLLF